MNILVVPTIRENLIKNFLESWSREPWDKIIVIEDNPNKTFDLNLEHHYSWKEIDDDLGEHAWIISNRDSAIRSYGFLKAFELGADYIFTIDDDCLPNKNHIEKHIKSIENSPQWAESITGLRTRGLPYFNLGKLNNVVLNMGLWLGVPDFDGIQSISNPITNFIPPNGNKIIPYGQYVAVCGMNLAFKREIAVLMYFPLMGENSLYGRFDDIWCGIILKKICDHLKLYISVGEPHVQHNKASNPFKNLIKEAPGIELNETLWETINNITLTENSPITAMYELGSKLNNNSNKYLSQMGQAIIIWTSLFAI